MCRCPVLLAAAEMERMLELGVELDSYHPLSALVIGRLRQEHGCRGPRKGACPWGRAMLSGSSLQPRDDVPRIEGKSGSTGQYL
jgi:hypothetical protein